ncbi:MAG: hypothetical protein HY678_09175 [Chloroflexi bacterium]|nr:hypothetical protein [Chloroflexota bacterium]
MFSSDVVFPHGGTYRMQEGETMADAEVREIILSKPGDSGQRQYDRVPLRPGTRAADILNQLKLKDMVLVKADGTEFTPLEDVYSQVESGQKVYAEPRSVEAG